MGNVAVGEVYHLPVLWANAIRPYIKNPFVVKILSGLCALCVKQILWPSYLRLRRPNTRAPIPIRIPIPGSGITFNVRVFSDQLSVIS